MEQFLADTIAWLEAQPDWLVYVGILVISYAENVLPPIPGDLLIVFGGYLASTSSLSLTIVILLATVGGTLGFMSMYEIGRRLGSRILDEEKYKWLPKRRIHRSMDWFGRVGYRLILANRFLSGLRSVISLTVGMAKTSPGKTTTYSAISAAVWVSLLAALGFALGENWELVRGYLSRYGQFIGVLIVAFIVVQFARYWVNVKNRGTDDAADG